MYDQDSDILYWDRTPLAARKMYAEEIQQPVADDAEEQECVEAITAIAC